MFVFLSEIFDLPGLRILELRIAQSDIMITTIETSAERRAQKY